MEAGDEQEVENHPRGMALNRLEADLALSCCRLAVQSAAVMCGSFRGCADKMEAEVLCWYIWRALFY